MKTVKQIEETSRQVFMAGIGIVGLSKDYAVHKLDNIMEGVNGLVNELLIRGEEVEHELEKKSKVQYVKERRIAQIRKRLGLANDTYTTEIDTLSHKLDELTKVIDKLAEQKAAQREQAKVEQEQAEQAAQSDTAEKSEVQSAEVENESRVAVEEPASETAETNKNTGRGATRRNAPKNATGSEAAKPATRRNTRSRKPAQNKAAPADQQNKE